MAWLEQIPVAGENEEFQEWINTLKKEITNANLQTDEDIENGVVTDSELSEEEVEKQANEDVSNPESKKQIDQLIKLWDRVNQLTAEQQQIYNNLMRTIRTELDKDIPTVLDMKKAIDVKYYNDNPEEAAKMADEIAKDTNNMWDVGLVLSVVSRRDYLSEEHQQKLDKVLDEVLNNLDDATKNLLEK